MNSRPFTLTFLAVTYFGIALSFPLQIMFLYDHSVFEASAILSKLTILNWTVIFGLLVAGILALKASSALLIINPILIIAVGVNNYFVGKLATDYSWSSTFIASMIFVAVNLLCFERKAFSVLTDRKLRWWQRARRVNTQLPVELIGNAGRYVSSHTVDISRSGVFVKVDEDERSHLNLHPGSQLHLRLRVDDQHFIQCLGRLVREADSSKGNYPEGFGIEFENLGYKHRRALNEILHEGFV